MFEALADPTRRKILDLLCQGETRAGELAARFSVSWPAISRHLNVLRKARVITLRRAGRARHYQVDHRHLKAVLGPWVDQVLGEDG